MSALIGASGEARAPIQADAANNQRRRGDLSYAQAHIIVEIEDVRRSVPGPVPCERANQYNPAPGWLERIPPDRFSEWALRSSKRRVA